MKHLLKTIMLGIILSNLSYAEAFSEVTRKKLFTAGVNDAIKCKDKIVGDHLSEVEVYEVKTLVDGKGYYGGIEISSSSGFFEQCNSTEIAIRLPNYFHQIKDGKKYRNHTRIWANGKESFKCSLDNDVTHLQRYKLEELQKHPFLVVKKVYGLKDYSLYENKEINYLITDQNNNEFFKCNNFEKNKRNSSNRTNVSDYTLNKEKLKFLIENKNVDRHFGFCHFRKYHSGYTNSGALIVKNIMYKNPSFEFINKEASENNYPQIQEFIKNNLDLIIQKCSVTK